MKCVMTHDHSHANTSCKNIQKLSWQCPSCGHKSRLVDGLLTKCELAQVLKKSIRWIEIQTKKNDMPHLRIGGTDRFLLDEVLDWADRQAEEK